MKIPRLSEKEALILNLLLSRGQMYGLQMVKAEPRKLKRGTIYVTLSRMVDKNYVRFREKKQAGEQGPPRILYSATGYGCRVLRGWETASEAFALGVTRAR